MFKLTVVTPEKRVVIDQDITEVTVPGFKGELNILPGHAPLITTLETGIMRWKLKGQANENLAVVSWGYCQVHPEGVDVLADVADLPEDVDVKECQEYLAQAEKRLVMETLDEEHWASLQREVARMRADLELVKGRRLS